MKNLTVNVLANCGANRKASAKYLPNLNELLPYYKINTGLRLAHFLAQVLHESIALTAVEEQASGIKYEGRKDLGNTEPGDGVRFKGRGLIQVTGRANYAEFKRIYQVDCIADPEILTVPRWAVATALWYWNSRKLNALADKDNLLAITKKVNGGLNGLESREKYLVKSKIALVELF